MTKRPPNIAGSLWVGCVLVTAGWFGWSMGGVREAEAIPSLPVAGIAMPICTDGNRYTCIVDGDTIRYRGERIRLEGFNTPEMQGQCRRETEMARQAQRRLQQLLHNVPFSIHRSGIDRYGRTLATVRTSNGDVGDVLIREGLAHVWRGRQENWC